MLRKLFLKTLNKYASRWLVLLIDILLVCFAFIVAYAIRFNPSFNFYMSSIKEQLLLIICTSLVSFLLVGSYKGIIRHTGTKDIFNVFLGVSVYTLCIGFIVLLNQFICVS